jgi:hypothetical protein
VGQQAIEAQAHSKKYSGYYVPDHSVLVNITAIPIDMIQDVIMLEMVATKIVRL